MFDVKFTPAGVVFTNTKTQKSDAAIALLDVMPTEKAVGVLTAEARAATSASAAAVSLLTMLIKDARCDSYKGKTPVREALPKEFKAAVRDLEAHYLRPVFVDQLLRKVPEDAPDDVKRAQVAKAEEKFQQWCSGALRTGGAYAQAKSKVLAYFAQCGKTPEVFTGEGENIEVHLLSVAAIDKLLQNAREADARQESGNEGISQKLVALNVDLSNRAERTKLGSYPEAIRALKDMLATYEKLQQELDEQRTKAGAGGVGDTVAEQAAGMAEPVTPDSVADVAQAAIAQAQKQEQAAPL